MTVLGVRIINGKPAAAATFTSTGCTECNTDLCNSGHRSVVASASVGLLSGALLMGIKSVLL
uniref:Protein quiver n=1 Tax=Macrostomum lignano TaxID=282301 RepID=A0A1I8F7L2_9PLAT